MPQRVYVLGGLPEKGDPEEVSRALTLREPAFQWVWIQNENEQFRLPEKSFKRLLHELRQENSKEQPDLPVVVKLYRLHGREKNQIHSEHGDPILAPAFLSTSAELIEWLLSPEAGIVPPRIWALPIRAVGLLAALSKLIRNKSWNKDVQGHAWTKEVNLLGQAPVLRPGYPAIYNEAVGCIDRAETSGLLLSKGGSQGKTPKEFCINTDHLPAVKRSLLGRNLDPLRDVTALTALMNFVDRGDPTLVALDSVILSERVLATCREADRLPENG